MTSKTDLPSQRPDALDTSAPDADPAPATDAKSGKIQKAPAEPERSNWNKPLPPGFGEAYEAKNDFAAFSDEERAEKLEALRAQLKNLESVGELEFELDGLQKKGFELDERLRPLDGLRKRLREAEVVTERLNKAADLPADLPQQKRDFAQRQAEHRAEVAALDEKKKAIDERLQAELARAPDARGLVQAAFQHDLVKYGLGAGVLFLAVGCAGFAGLSELRWAALLDIPAFGVALYGAMQFLAGAEGAALLRGQLARLGRDRERLESRFDLETTAFRALLKRYELTIDDVDEVEEMIGAYQSANHEAESARAAIAEAVGDDDLEALVARREELSAQIKAKEEELYEAGGFAGDRARLEAEIRELENPQAASPEPEPEEEAEPEPEEAEPVVPAGERTSVAVQRLVSFASDLMVSSMDVTCATLQPRVGQYLAGMSDRRFGQMIFGAKGEVSVVDAASGRAVPFHALPPGDRDLVYLSLKMTVVEAGVRAGRLPVILDRAFETFPAIKQPLIVRMLQFLSQGTQVLLMTRIPTVAGAGESPIALPPP